MPNIANHSLQVALERAQNAANSLKNFAAAPTQTGVTKEAPNLERNLALGGALKALSGVKATSVESNENGSMVMVLEIKQCEAVFELNSSSQLTSIQIQTKEFAWIDVANIMNLALAFPAPNDIRYVVWSIAQAQSIRTIFAEDIAVYRRKLLIKTISPVEVELTFRTGLTCTIQAQSSYGQGPIGAMVTKMVHIDIDVTEEQLEMCTMKVNAIAAKRLSELVEAIEQLGL